MVEPQIAVEGYIASEKKRRRKRRLGSRTGVEMAKRKERGCWMSRRGRKQAGERKVQRRHERRDVKVYR